MFGLQPTWTLRSLRETFRRQPPEEIFASIRLGSPAHQWSGFQVRPHFSQVNLTRIGIAPFIQLENHSAFPCLRQTTSLKTLKQAPGCTIPEVHKGHIGEIGRGLWKQAEPPQHGWLCSLVSLAQLGFVGATWFRWRSLVSHIGFVGATWFRWRSVGFVGAAWFRSLISLAQLGFVGATWFRWRAVLRRTKKVVSHFKDNFGVDEDDEDALSDLQGCIQAWDESDADSSEEAEKKDEKKAVNKLRLPRQMLSRLARMSAGQLEAFARVWYVYCQFRVRFSQIHRQFFARCQPFRNNRSHRSNIPEDAGEVDFARVPTAVLKVHWGGELYQLPTPSSSSSYYSYYSDSDSDSSPYSSSSSSSYYYYYYYYCYYYYYYYYYC